MPRSFDHDPTDLIGVDRFPSAGDRFDLEVANLLVAHKRLSLTGLATAMRRRAETAARLAEAIIATGLVAPNDYYRAVAECYGLPFIDLEMQPIDPTLAHDEDRADYAQRAMVPWQSRNGRLVIAATSLSRENVEWADTRFGDNGYDFVITSPAAIQRQTQALFGAGSAVPE